MLHTGRLAIGILAVAACASAASAQKHFGLDYGNSGSPPATFANSGLARTSFLGSLVGVGTETFESFSAGTVPATLTFPGAGTASFASGLGGSIYNTGMACCGRYPGSGVNYLETQSASSGSTFSISFSAPVAAFGFFGTDIGDFGSQLSLQFWLGGSVIDTWLLPYVAASSYDPTLDGSAMYVGYINTGLFDRVDFLGTNGSDYFGFDDMTVGSLQQVNTAPEPGTWALMATGLGMAALVMRRRRRT
ncbi:MAG: PEP-CTERM sorting domain-containing protein [Gemmatimonadetes bacterium]|nr:PEP-CTERM sorting domain-containing protein [Gemmatimonadota bacterium]